MLGHDDGDRYYVGMVCLNGHKINERADQDREKNVEYCPICSERTTVTCEHCKQSIRGGRDGMRGFWRPKAFCEKCGKPFPWTERRIESAAEVLSELDELTPEDRESLKANVLDLVADTPRSDLAALRFGKALDKLAPASRRVLREVLKQISTDSVQRKLGLNNADA